MIDWRELYHANRAAIERSSGAPGAVSAARGDGRTIAVDGQGRRALVHAPARLESRSGVALVCMLHGCTQDAAAFAAVTRMNEASDRHGFVAVYPQQER